MIDDLRTVLRVLVGWVDADVLVIGGPVMFGVVAVLLVVIAVRRESTVPGAGAFRRDRASRALVAALLVAVALALLCTAYRLVTRAA